MQRQDEACFRGLAKTYYGDRRPEMLSFIPCNAVRVLEIGCGEGRFGESLLERGHIEVWGVEAAAGVVDAASHVLTKVVQGTFETVSDQLPQGYFDCIVCNDVIEHMVDPGGALLQMRSLLSANGLLVASIPNVLHVSVLRELLWRKDWRYSDSGVLDRTHLRFFTKASIERLFGDAGYDLQTIRGINSVSTVKAIACTILTLGWLRESRHLQFAVVAKPKPAFAG